MPDGGLRRRASLPYALLLRPSSGAPYAARAASH